MAQRVPIIQQRTWIVESSVVQHVECFQPQIHLLAFSDSEGPPECAVQIPRRRPEDHGSSGITESSRRLSSERRGIEPLFDGSIIDVPVPYYIRSIRSKSGE